MTIPESGVDAPDEGLDDAMLPFANPFDIPLAALPTAAGFLDHGVGAAAAGCALGPPSAGNASSDLGSNAGFGGAAAGGCSRAGCLPAAFADILVSPAGVATRDGSLDIGKLFMPEGAGCSSASSSGTSSTLAWCFAAASSCSCCRISRSAAVKPSPLLADASVAVAIVFVRVD